MAFKILHPYGQEAALWQSYVDRLSYAERDVLLTPAYARVQAELGQGDPICIYKDGLMLPALLKDGELKSFYGGVNLWGGDCKQLGIISEYRQSIVRGDGEKVKDAVIVDIDKTDDELFKSFSRNRQRGIKQSIGKGIEILRPDYPTDDFDRLYNQNMERLNAPLRWKYDHCYWIAYQEEMRGEYSTYLMAVDHEDERQSALLVLHGYGKAYAHFIGGDKHHDLLYFEAMKYARDVGCHTFFLGGGTTSSPDDKLLQYKLGFSKRTVPVYVYKREYVKETA